MDPTTATDALRAATRGVVAGALGTLAMDLVWYVRYRRGGGEDGFLSWEFSSSTTSFEDAGAPAQVGRGLVRTVVRRDLPDRAAGLTNNVVHWATGCQWGALYGAAMRWRPGASATGGVLLGPVAWGTAYALLGIAGTYEPIWRYDTETLAKDLSAHLVFGGATVAAYRGTRRLRRSSPIDQRPTSGRAVTRSDGRWVRGRRIRASPCDVQASRT